MLSTITLSYPTKFFRYTSINWDHRYSLGQIAQDTYLTSYNDHQFVNSGFGAVGRYALPLPLPASHEHQYTFSAGTRLICGTVAPQYGQAGGGVEVKTTSSVTGVRHDVSKPIDDY